MSKPYDATVKHLLQAYPADWLDLIGLRDAGPVTVVDSDLSTVSAAADSVFRVGDPNPWLLQFESQSGYDAAVGFRTLRYSVLLEYRHDLQVQSVVILLRPQADGPEMTGVIQRKLPNGEKYLEFKYHVIRVWELPVDSLLAGGLGLLPLAPLASATTHDLPGLAEVVQKITARLSSEADEAEAATLWAATYVLMGLRYTEEIADKVLQGVRSMKDSVTYQAILEEGRAEGRAEGEVKGRANEARALLLRMGTKALGQPKPELLANINSNSNIEQLEALVERVHTASTWEDLMGTP